MRQPNRRAGAKPIACACLRFFQICSVPIARVLEVNRTCGEGLTPYPAASSVRCEQMLLDVSRDRDAQVLGWVRGQQAKAPLTGDHPTTNRDPPLPRVSLVSCEGSRPVDDVEISSGAPSPLLAGGGAFSLIWAHSSRCIASNRGCSQQRLFTLSPEVADTALRSPRTNQREPKGRERQRPPSAPSEALGIHSIGARSLGKRKVCCPATQKRALTRAKGGCLG
jgi:hypothetical protein